MKDRSNLKKTISYLISGHRNPDVDSIMSAYALAEFKKTQNVMNVKAICPGVLPDRAAWLFRKFNMTPPQSRNDVYLRMSDIMSSPELVIQSDASLFDAVELLNLSGAKSLPVTDSAGIFLGMLSQRILLADLLKINSDAGESLTGRHIFSSSSHIMKGLKAEVISGKPDDTSRDYDVYVAAMSPEFFDQHLKSSVNEPAIIVGDRPEIHLRAIQRGIKLLIITGNCPVESMVIELAAQKGMTILRTAYDSATVTRRLKFSSPVSHEALDKSGIPLSPRDMVREFKSHLLGSPDDIFPICDESGHLVGTVSKTILTSPAPYRMILVDHNEISQGIPGLEEIPVVEVVDHHRIGMKPTMEPIKFTADVVGSTCTLVADMFRASKSELSSSLAGLLLSGIITDTILFKSPTSTELDREICAWLESIAGVSAESLMQELMMIDSPLAVKSASEVIRGDLKLYKEHSYRFALSQVEENNLELLHQRCTELKSEVERIIRSEGLDFMGLLVTDPVRGNSELLFIGSPAVARNMPYARRSDSIFQLPGVLSRKKQLLPQILSIIASVGKV